MEGGREVSTSVTMDPTVLVGEYLPKVVAAGRSPSCSVLLPGMESPPAGRNRRVVCHRVRYSRKRSFLGVSPFPMNPVNLHSLKTLLLPQHISSFLSLDIPNLTSLHSATRPDTLPLFCPSISQTSNHLSPVIQLARSSQNRHQRPSITPKTIEFIPAQCLTWLKKATTQRGWSYPSFTFIVGPLLFVSFLTHWP